MESNGMKQGVLDNPLQFGVWGCSGVMVDYRRVMGSSTRSNGRCFFWGGGLDLTINNGNFNAYTLQCQTWLAGKVPN